MCGFSNCNCGSITVQKGADGSGSSVIVATSGSSPISTNIYNSGSGITVASVTIPAGIIKNPTNTVSIIFNAEVQATDVFLAKATLNYNGVPSTLPYNISKVTIASPIAGTSYGQISIIGQLTNVVDGAAISVGLLASTGSPTPIVTSWSISNQIFQ